MFKKEICWECIKNASDIARKETGDTEKVDYKKMRRRFEEMWEHERMWCPKMLEKHIINGKYVRRWKDEISGNLCFDDKVPEGCPYHN